MNSLNQRLETVKPVIASPDTAPHPAVITPHTFDVRPRATRSNPTDDRRNRRRATAGRYQIQESESENTPTTWLSRLLSGWMFSLFIHCLILLWLGSMITNFKTEGPLTLNVSTFDDDIHDAISIEISAMELDDALNDASGGGALDPVIVEPETVYDLKDELQPEIDTSLLEPIAEELLLESTSDSSMFEPVNMGVVGLDEGDTDGKDRGKGNGKGKGKTAGVKFFGLESDGNRFVFVVDCSGSMGDENRYQRAVYELTRSMDMLETNHRFLVILYNSETYPMLGMTENNIRLIPATRTNKERVLEWLKQQQPQARTFPMVAMRTSLILKPSSIYFLSDGEFHDRTIPMLDHFNLEDRSKGTKKIPINTITLGSTGFGAPMMKYIANESGGRFLWVQ